MLTRNKSITFVILGTTTDECTDPALSVCTTEFYCGVCWNDAGF